MSTCGLIFNDEPIGPKDRDGCRLAVGHQGPHEFVARCGTVYQWETDLECDCNNSCDGDYCTVYWKRDGRQQDGAA